MVRRHDLVWLTPQGWEGALARLDGAPRELARRWRANDLPAVVRRREPDLPASLVCLGIPAPPDAQSGQKVRLGFAAEARHIAQLRPALALQEVQAPAIWQAELERLGFALRAAGIDCRVFGSLAMQTLTGERYLGPQSDIDLLLQPSSVAELDVGLALLEHHADFVPLDGEIAFPSGHAVSWKEWLGAGVAAGAERVLAKHLDSVSLMRRDTLLGQLGQPWAREDRHG